MAARLPTAVATGLVAFVVGACGATQRVTVRPEASPDQPRGTLTGTVVLRTGNCMPGPAVPDGCTTEPVATTVSVHEPLVRPTGATDDAAPGHPSPGPAVASGRSGDDGRYEFAVPAGRWSVLVDDDGRPWCNRFEQTPEGLVACPVTIRAGQTAQHDITIDRAAH